ncbi:MAG: hypothetical protein JNK82_21940 [Myxococcaceae bacterium]|nr:hypothetical protein [Myxococcaceae bacterium]
MAALEANPTFPRDGGWFGIATLSDSDDRSPQPVQTYVDALKALSSSVMLDAIGPQQLAAPAGCSYDSTAGQPRSAAAAQALRGSVGDICLENFGWVWANPIGTPFGPRHTFFLTAQPVISTLTVTVDGVALAATALAYDAVRGTVDVPAGVVGLVEIRYLPVCH